MKELISLYKDGQQEMKIGLRFDEIYDLDTLEPSQAWLETYDSVYQEVQEMGVPLA